MKPKQVFYAIAAAAGVALLATGYMYWISAASLSAKSQQLGELLADVKLAQDKSDQLKVLSDDYNARVKPKLGLLGTLLPRDKEQAKIADQVNSIARSSGVSVSGLTFSATAGGAPAVGPALSVPVTFQAGGSYGEVMTFLQGIENFPRLSDIATLSINKGSADGDDVSANFTLNVYYKP